ncbi:aspartate aminotransferase [Thiohalorhabdus denitrificans]|uniref:pyridoxal phosphate-dependent aminotransferase n=1 Tax=Thiohalorhabdus denitrificans TaxID=381306 RepID=UPI0006D5ADA8|nr:pyridoxal phosphate-dependent aminotransferase [Thiohalorhabdus denitrificans]KPV40093.1 aspartate aminotransferase [Thiohalorhabdus denitrificans]
MALRLSDRVQRIQPSPTLAVTARAAELRDQGRDVIGLGAGEPDFTTPEPIRAAAKAAIDGGHTKYTPVDGMASLKRAITAKFRTDNGLEYGSDEVIVSTGGKQVVYNLAQALLQEGDEAVIPAPYWVSYPDIVKLAGAEPATIETDDTAGFKISAYQLDSALNERTRLLILNSPSNPTGALYSEAELEALAEVLRKHPQVVILTDDIYEKILLGSTPFRNILNVAPDLKDRTVVLNGVSKAFAMTGWRIGYAAGPRDLIGAMKKLQSQSTSNPASISQHAALAALESDPELIQPMVEAFRERHNFVSEALNALPYVSCRRAEGAFYLFPSFHSATEALGLEDDVALATHLLDQAGVALVPGSAFGAPGYLRLSFATDLDSLKAAMDRIGKVLAG